MEESIETKAVESEAREGLRTHAERVWKEHKELEESLIEERLAEEEQVLREKLVELGALPDEITIKHKGGRITAEVEGMRFISTYSDPHLAFLSPAGKSRPRVVILLWTCPECGREERVGWIRDGLELGRALEEIEAGGFHVCMSRI